MAKKPVEIHIDMDKKCKGCGNGGAAPSGYCFACLAKKKCGKVVDNP